MAELLEPAGNKTAMRIHLQRVVGSLVSSAHGAATFYSGRPRAHHQARQRKDREEDCDGVLAFDAKCAGPRVRCPGRPRRLRPSMPPPPAPFTPTQSGSLTSPPSSKRKAGAARPPPVVSGEGVRLGRGGLTAAAARLVRPREARSGAAPVRSGAEPQAPRLSQTGSVPPHAGAPRPFFTASGNGDFRANPC